jgi:hypothetical protein
MPNAVVARQHLPTHLKGARNVARSRFVPAKRRFSKASRRRAPQGGVNGASVIAQLPAATPAYTPQANMIVHFARSLHHDFASRANVRDECSRFAHVTPDLVAPVRLQCHRARCPCRGRRKVTLRPLRAGVTFVLPTGVEVDRNSPLREICDVLATSIP